MFIDEAYSLKRADSHGSDYGQVAIDTLVAAMTSGEYAGRFVVILAGYPEEMRTFLMANPGLRSRFPVNNHFHLPDYSTDELVEIARRVAKRNDYAFAPAALAALRERIERERVDETFGNARTVKNIVLSAIFAKSRRLESDEPLWIDDFTLLSPDDFADDRSPRVSGEAGEAADARGEEARERISRLVGLHGVKAELAKLAAFVRMQRERREAGLPAVPVELHSVFIGNPGTGKTTVAHLYAQLLREIGYLKRGHLIVAGRADLVAGYVGQTAAKTRRKIREALGGVLFIDEAYALATGGETDFGREAIDTLVDEMTRHQENLVVILAGYPEEMERLLAANPGLASRFKKTFVFPDYTAEELLQIIRADVEEKGYRLDEQAVPRLVEELLRRQQTGRLEGNARFARDLVQASLLEQVFRLAALPPDARTRDRLSLLVWDDFAPLFRSGV